MKHYVQNCIGQELPLIEDISIKDFALIDSVFLELGDGFTVLSGETGAGKSILISAISFLLGGKGGIELIRAGASEARVSGTVRVSNSCKEAIFWLKEHGIEPENGRLLLRRLIRESGKSAAWIQDIPVTRTELAEFMSWCIDIHGQHEHQSLMRVAEHRRFLDSYAGIEDSVAQFTVLYTQLVEKRQILADIDISDNRRTEKIDLLTFAVQEIEESLLKEGEDLELIHEENRLSQYEKLYQEIDSFGVIIADSGSANTGIGFNALSALKKASASLSHAASMDTSLESLAGRMESLFYELSDVADEVRSYTQSLVFDPARLEEVQERQALLFKLKKKYALSTQSPLTEVITYAEKARLQLEQLALGETTRKFLQDEIVALEKTAYTRAQEISAKRRLATQKMALAVESVLTHLGMKGTKFTVQIEQKKAVSDDQKCGPYGIDNIEFLISPNPGTPAKPLAKIASGGELSRVMLALKTVLDRSDIIDTLIFDEIDTGIGGEVSVAVGKHLKQLAAGRQVLCITHLASIAVYADTQIKIEKSIQVGKTSTHVYPIVGEQRVQEISRMLSGDARNPASLEHARTLLQTYGERV